MEFDRHNTIVVAIAVTVCLVLGLWICVWGAVRATEADRNARSVHYQSCRPIEDDAIRALCLAKSR